MTQLDALDYQVLPLDGSASRGWAAGATTLLGMLALTAFTGMSLAALAFVSRGTSQTAAALLASAWLLAVPLAGTWGLLALVRGVWARNPPACVAALVLAGFAVVPLGLGIASLVVHSYTLWGAVRLCTHLSLLAVASTGTVVFVTLARRQRPVAGPEKPRALTLRFYFEDVCIAAPAFVFAVLALVFVVPLFREIFSDFRTNLPAATEWLLNASHVVASEPYGVLLVLALAWLIPVPALMYRLGHRPDPCRKRSLRWLVLLSLLATMGAALVTGVALFLPLIKLIQSVSGGEAGTP